MSIHSIHFHTIAGKRVRLKGFQGFRGGLDSEKDMTGEFSVQTEFAGLEIMFHVATFMPFDPNDPQQVNLGEVHVQYSMQFPLTLCWCTIYLLALLAHWL